MSTQNSENKEASNLMLLAKVLLLQTELIYHARDIIVLTLTVKFFKREKIVTQDKDGFCVPLYCGVKAHLDFPTPSVRFEYVVYAPLYLVFDSFEARLSALQIEVDLADTVVPSFGCAVKNGDGRFRLEWSRNLDLGAVYRSDRGISVTVSIEDNRPSS